MRAVMQQLIDALDAERPAAFCQLVETRGSTPQKAGAGMLVFVDGTQAGTLGGGCVEAEVKRRAQGNILRNACSVETFDLDHDFGWDDGLICGGRMKVLIDPLSAQSDVSYYRQLHRMVSDSSGVTQAIVFDDRAAGLPAASSFLFDGDGQLLASRAHCPIPRPPLALTELLVPLSDRPRAYAKSGIGFLPILPRCRLLIVGGGHVGQAVADMAADVDFDVWVVDDREAVISAERFPKSARRIAGSIGDTLPNVEVTANTYCLIVTRGHKHDEEALFHLIDRGARYVGLIGSRRKIRLIFEDLRAEGVGSELLDSVYAPVGIDIGSQTVSEIAVSIVAELVAHRNCQGQVPGRPQRISVQA